MNELIVPQNGVSTRTEHQAARAKEQSEVQAQVFLAMQRPRVEEAAFAKLLSACERLSFAEAAEYNYPRGGGKVTGPSVYLAREAARIWGNIRYGFRIVDSDLDTVRIRGFAHDLETNAFIELDDEAQKSIQRKNKSTGETQWVEADEREIRELVNKRGAILVRNCLLSILPSDIIERAVEECRKTAKKAAAGALGQTREDQLRNLTFSFSKVGVTAKQLETWAGRAIQELTADQITELRQIHNSIKDGQSSAAEYFETAKAQAADLTEAIKSKGVEK